MKEGGLGDVKFTLVSYLPRYPTDLLVPHAVLAIRCRRPDERGRSVSRAHVLLVCIHVLHLQAARTEVVQQVVQQRGAHATVALVHVPACCESCECPLGVSWACPTSAQNQNLQNLSRFRRDWREPVSKNK